MERFDRRGEWRTWSLLVGCHVGWLATVFAHATLGALWVPLAVAFVALHSSLQHELLHGHPTRSRRLNELLAQPALGLFVPYRRFRDLHIAHHRDERLTDPYDDPESWYLSAARWTACGAPTRRLLAANATLLGRVALGPALGLAGFWRADARALRRGERTIARAWCLHALALLPVLGALALAGIHPLLYALVVAYPAMSVLMVRSFVEHRAAEAVGERTAVVEAGRLASLLFLNNNLHAVHHDRPSLPWYALPGAWRASRERVLAGNGGYHFPGGYAEVARRWLLRPREPIVHPGAVPSTGMRGGGRDACQPVPAASGAPLSSSSSPFGSMRT